MSEKFVEHQIRYTWRSIYKMHNEQAVKAGGTLAQAVVLLNLNPNKERPQPLLVQKWDLNQQAWVELLNRWKMLDSFQECQTKMIKEEFLLY